MNATVAAPGGHSQRTHPSLWPITVADSNSDWSNYLVRGDHPNSWKNAPRMQGQMKIFRVGSRQFRESLRELLRELWVSYWSSRERPFREWNFVFREWNFQFRELLREYPGTLRELREWPFHSESVFLEIGVVPRLLINNYSTELGPFWLFVVTNLLPMVSGVLQYRFLAWIHLRKTH